MSLRIEKGSSGDLIVLGLVGLFVGFLGLHLAGVITLNGRGGDLRLVVTLLVCAVASIPILARWQSSAPLVEMDDEHVTFSTGWTRSERCRIPRAGLLLVSVDTHNQELFLSLLFDAGALRPLRQCQWTPYLEIKSDEVIIAVGHVRGNAEQVAETWNQAIQSRAGPAGR